MSAGDIFKVETVFIADPLEGGAGNVPQPKITNQEHATPPERRARPPAMAAGTTFMDAAVDKHGSVPQRRGGDAAGLPEVSSGFFPNRTSPTDSADALTPMASSRESLLSEGWDRERGWPVTSPASLSRTVSPCSSVLSGVFSPAVVPIRKHFLAPGSSLIHTPQTCFSSSESLSSCPRSPPPRRRPPLTRLSLLTAILRKGRLPVLSASAPRPYTPCWPVNRVTLSFCNACSAASSVASIPLELSSRFSSTTSIDSQSHLHREPQGCSAAPAPPDGPSGPGGAPRCEQVISPPPLKPHAVPQTSLPRLSPRSGSASPAPRAQRAETKVQQRPNIYLSKSFKLEPGGAHVRGRADPPPPLTPPPSERARDRKSPATNSSLSKLHMLSEKLRSPPRPSPQPCAAPAPSPPPRSRPPGGGGGSEGSRGGPGLPPARPPRACSPRWPSPFGPPGPSPSLSLRSTPSPRPGSGTSDYGDREGKKRKTHKIKLSYKSLAAIPTNTLLLDQQVIDEQVERGHDLCGAEDEGVPDTHAEMCSPAQFRQQSAELYAVIDEVLADSIPTTPQHSRTPTPVPGLQAQQNNSSSPKSLGRETKYASLGSLHPSNTMDRHQLGAKKMKPGIIRPMTAIPRLRVEDEEGYQRDAFGQFDIKGSSGGGTKVEAQRDFYTLSTRGGLRDMWMPERRSPSTVWDLQITEADEGIGPPVRDASASFSSKQS